MVSPPDSPELQCLPKSAQAAASQGISEIVRRLASVPPSLGAQESLDALIGSAPSGAHFTWGINPVPLTRINLLVEAGVLMPATVLRPRDGQGGGFKGTLLSIDDEQKESLASDPIVQEALRRDYVVWEIDPRGFGEIAVQQPAWEFAASLLVGDNFVWRQAWDIRGFADDLCNSGGGPHGSLALYARGPNSSLAATYAVKMLGSSCLDWAVLRGGYTSIQQFLDYPAVIKTPVAGQSIPYNYFAFGALRAPDLPQLLAAARARTYLIDPLDLPSARAAQSDRVRVATIEEFFSASW